MNKYDEFINKNQIYKLEKNNNLLRANIELLTKCNWRCKHCYIPEHNDIGFSIDIIKNLFNQLRELGTFEILLTGGEIFYKKDILTIIKLARDLFFNVILFSNVSMLNEELIKELSQLYISGISCTIFSLDENIHDSITGISGSLNKALENIMLIKKYNIPLEIKTVLMKPNYKSHMKLLEFCEKNNFAYLPTTIVTAKNNGDISPLQLRLSKEQLFEILPYIEKESDFKIKKNSLDDYMCETIRYSIFIDCKGNVYPCDTFKCSVGNIYNEKIKDIWYKSKKLDVIKNLRKRDLGECVNCNHNEFCYKCPGITLLEDGNILSKSTLACEQASVRHKLNLKGEIKQ